MPKRPGRKSAAQTPAPRSERIYGSKKNKPGSASGQSEAKISLSPQIKKALKKKADEFNEKHPTKRVRVTTLEKVFRRGAGAYSKSHRPTITGNVPNTRSAWSFARVNKFLKKKSGQKVKAAYVQDDDLLMDGGEVMAKGGLLIQYTSVPKYLYHATYKPLLNTIEKEGLGGTSAKRNWDFSEEGVIYLAIDDEVALSFAETADNVKDDWLDEIIILKIDTTKLDKTRFFIDRNLLDDYDLDDDFISFEYHGVIPFESVVDFYENNYSKGGKVKFNDKELLAKYNRGESIGFTAVAHLKAKGLIPRADGTKRKSEKYLEDGGSLIYERGGRLNVLKEEDRLGVLNYDDTHEYLQKKYKKYKKNDAKLKDLPSIFIRAGLPPIKKDGSFGVSINGISGKKEEGVSVFNAKYSPNSDFVFVDFSEAGGDTDINLAYRDSQFYEDDGVPEVLDEPTLPKDYNKYTRKMYLVSGEIVGYGSDGETLLDNKTIKVIGNLNPNKVVPPKSFLKEYQGGINTYFSGKEFKEYPKYNDGGLIAPNGKPSNLTPEQYNLVRTPEFKAWFGDWENDPENASKVVDENGEPLVVYHGTSALFNTFKEEEKGKRGGLNEKFWSFTTNIEQAKIYALDNRLYGSFSTPRIIPVFLNIKEMPSYDNQGKFYRELEVWGGYKYIDIFQLQDWHSRGFNMGVEFKEVDGFEVKNTIEMEVRDALDKAQLIGNTYYVRNSNQIKLADGTNTTFDGTNPDIRYNDGGVVFVRNKNYDNSQTIRRLPYRGVSAFAVATDDFEKFKQYAEKEEGVDPSNWQVYDMDDFDNYQVCAMKMSETNDYVMGWSDDKPKLEPFDAQEHTMYIDEDGNLDYEDAHEIIILPTKTMDRGGMTAIFVNNMLESAKDIDNIIEYALENDIKPTDPEFNTKVNPDGKYSAFEIRLAKRELKKYSHGGELPMQVTCKKCGWSWNTADSQPQDATMCHKCGFDNVSEDIISMNAPTYLRSLEFAREDAKEDVDLHKVTENAVALSKEHPIRMKEYDELVKLENGGVLPELTDEELAFMRKMMKSSPLLRKFMDSEEIKMANRLVKKGWLEKGTSSDTPHSVIYLVELKPADIEKYGLDEYADGGQLFAYEPKEYDIQEFICKEQDLADVVSNRGDMTKLGKIRVCQAKINLAEDKLKNATSDREVEAWYMSTCIWTDCMNGLKSNYKSGGKVGGCGCYKDGGLAYGNSHDKGGMPLTVKSTGQNIEIEGGEGVVNKRSMQMNKTVEFQGKKLTPCEVVSKINEMGGGVKFKCDDVKKIIAEDGHFD